MIGAELQAHVAHGRRPFTSRTGNHGAQIVRWRRHGAEDPVLSLGTDPLLLAIPQGLIGDGDIAAVLPQHEGIGEIGNRRQGIEVRREFASTFDPFLPSILMSAEPSRRRYASRWENPQKEIQILPPLVGAFLSKDAKWNQKGDKEC